MRTMPGIIVATAAVATGVVSEALFIGWQVSSVLKGPLRAAPAVQPPLTFPAFISFYVPLAMTSLITLLAPPIGSAALNRMPLSLESLAVWPVISGLLFMLRSMGVAYNEVVVSLIENPLSMRPLRRFTWGMMLASTALIGVITATPLAAIWFAQVSALQPTLADMGRAGLWLALPTPALAFLQSWYQGVIVHSKQTRGITESVVVYLLTNMVVFASGLYWKQTPGLYFALAALMLGMMTQTGWLWWRSYPALKVLSLRDEASQTR